MGKIPSSTFGPSGIKIKLVFFEEDAQAEISVENYKKETAKKNIDVIVGYVLSGNCEEIAPLAEERKVLTVLSTCGTLKIFEETITNPQYLFRTASHAMLDSVSTALYLEKYYPEVRKVGGLNPHYSWGIDAWRYFQDSLSELLGVKDYKGLLIEVGTEDYCDSITDFKNYSPEIVFSSFSVSDLIKFTNSIQNCNFSPNVTLAIPTGLSILPRFKELIDTKVNSPIIIGARGVPSKFLGGGKVDDYWFEERFMDEYGYEPNYYAYRIVQDFIWSEGRL